MPTIRTVAPCGVIAVDSGGCCAAPTSVAAARVAGPVASGQEGAVLSAVNIAEGAAVPRTLARAAAILSTRAVLPTVDLAVLAAVPLASAHADARAIVTIAMAVVVVAMMVAAAVAVRRVRG